MDVKGGHVRANRSNPVHFFVKHYFLSSRAIELRCHLSLEDLYPTKLLMQALTKHPVDIGAELDFSQWMNGWRGWNILNQQSKFRTAFRLIFFRLKLASLDNLYMIIATY